MNMTIRKRVTMIVGVVLALFILTGMALAMTSSGAYFKDSSNVTNNKICLGTLDIATDYTTGALVFENVYPGWNYHDASHWGYDFPTAVIVQNTGSLPVKYRMKGTPTGGTYNDALLDTVLCSVAVETGISGEIRSIYSGTLRGLMNWNVIETNFATSGHSGWYGTGQRVRIYMAVPPEAGNEIMGQSLIYTLTFEATQTINPAW